MSLVSNLLTRGACAAVLAGTLCATSAWAQQPPPSGQPAGEDKAAAALKLSDEGLAFFKARDYRRASEKFLEAYALDPDPNLLFNLGRCYEALGDTAAAIDKYEQFVTKPGADSQAKLKAEEALKTLRQMQNKPASSAPTASTTSGGGTPAGSTDADSKKRSGGSLTPYAWVGVGFAVVGGTIGTVMYMLGVGDHDDVTSAAGYGQKGKVVQLTQKEAQSLVDSGDTKKTVGVVSWAIGGVGLAAAVVLFTLPRSKESTTALTVRGVPSRSGGAIRVEGTF